MTELEDLKKLLAEATNRPWKANTADKTGEEWLIASLGNSNEDGLDYIVTTDRVRASELDGDAKADAALIAAAVNALPGMIARVEEMERLKTRVKTLETALGPFAQFADDVKNGGIQLANSRAGWCLTVPVAGAAFLSVTSLSEQNFTRAGAALRKEP